MVRLENDECIDTSDAEKRMVHRKNIDRHRPVTLEWAIFESKEVRDAA